MGADMSMPRLAADPGFLVARVGAAALDGFREVLAARGIKPLQYLVLMVLDARGGISQQELCAATGVDSGNMVELIDSLEALGYAGRARDERDRRRHVVTITARGRSDLARLRRDVAEFNERFLSPLTGAERRQLAAALGKVYATTPEGRRAAPGAGTG